MHLRHESYQFLNLFAGTYFIRACKCHSPHYFLRQTMLFLLTVLIDDLQIWIEPRVVVDTYHSSRVFCCSLSGTMGQSTSKILSRIGRHYPWDSVDTCVRQCPYLLFDSASSTKNIQIKEVRVLYCVCDGIWQTTDLKMKLVSKYSKWNDKVAD